MCSPPQFRGELSDEEYRPYLAAADLKHDTYMRWAREPMPPGALHATVVVNQTAVAWIQYDGVARVIERTFPDPTMNTVRDLARQHLGADPLVQQHLADKRADIEKMGADTFPRVIGNFLGYAAPGSRFNDFPTGISVREWSNARRAEARITTGKEYPHVPHPTRELTDDERRPWADKAAEYAAAFERRFPAEFKAWEFRNWWDATRDDRYHGGSLNLRAEDRVLVELSGVLTPGVVLWKMKTELDGTEIVDLLVEPDSHREDDGHRHWIKLYSGYTMRYEDVPAEAREMWAQSWSALAERAKKFRTDIEG
ncbi:hypothetical protein [Actinacidiphila sp. ITFR-21]|uniref:hypothetical protein n=1 Tax=Actinacidiphila sp. ITFR-21 TaxID=3075199 RepID=UPI00288BB113|nr:hypothetical protein [Streptomyces sp. ITFR-21]WNI17671.1 hypothetical protein RLT57_20490 [Streptomyces sp. ITFR-21]WNI17811.1 hypothetical protein RLT57_21205 [Streptomyces sp. ITFR-21]